MPKIFESFKRVGKFDFDADSTFENLDAAKAYVTNPASTAYFGQRIFVKSETQLINNTYGENGEITSTITTDTGKFGDVYTVKKKYVYDENGHAIKENNEFVFEWYLDKLITGDNFIEALDKSKDELIEMIKDTDAALGQHKEKYEQLYNELKQGLTDHIDDFEAHGLAFEEHINEFQDKIDGISDRTGDIEARLQSIGTVMAYGGTFTTLPELTVTVDGVVTACKVGDTVKVDGKDLPLLVGTVIGTASGKEYVLDLVTADGVEKLEWIEFGDITAEASRIQKIEDFLNAHLKTHIKSVTSFPDDSSIEVKSVVSQTSDDGTVKCVDYQVRVVLQNSALNSITETSSGLAVRVSNKQDNALELISDADNNDYAGGLYVAPHPKYELVAADTATSGYLATYYLERDGVQAGTAINIPKDMLVQKGDVVTFTDPDNLPTGVSKVGTYIALTLANNPTTIYVDVTTLIEYVTGAATAEIAIEVSADHVVTATLVPGSISKSKLDSALVAEIEHSNREILNAITAERVAKWDRDTRVFRVSTLEEITDTDLVNGDIAIVTANVDGNDDGFTTNDWTSTAAYVWDSSIDNGVTDAGEPVPSGNWAALTGNVSADNIYFSKDFIFTTTIGTVTELTDGNAMVAAAGKNMTQFFSSLFAKEEYPSAEDPFVSLSTEPTTNSHEVGSEITPKYKATLNAGSYTYGPETGITAKKWTVTIANTGEASKSSAESSFNKFTITDGMSGYAKITATAEYDAGEVPVTNIGNDHASAQIPAGSKSATSTGYSGYRGWFCGYKNGDSKVDIDSIDSTFIRSLTKANGSFKSSLATTKMQQMFFAAPAGLVKSVAVADATNGAPQTVKTKTVYVKGANNYTAPDTDTVKETTNGGMAYDLFYVSNDNANSGDATYKITVTKN